ncbi:MAG TPA: hypothetical protein VFB60_04735 [Ktedonobacteraceae bacterium]|nr:hypothetical protein [Ktedonobacteraceae bacterium]
MTNEESNQGQGTPDPNAAAGQPSFPPPQDTPPSYPYPPAQQPLQQPITGGSSPQNFPAPPPYMPAQQQPYQQPNSGGSSPQNFPTPPPYMPAQQQPYQQPITGGAPQGYPPTPPPYPYAQQQPYPQYAGGGEATQAYAPAPTPYPYTPPVAPKKSNRGLKILLIVLAVVVVLGAGGGGVLIYILTRPQPVITVTSNYKVGTLPAGSTTTTFHIIGQKFSGSEAITFLLDGAPAPGSQAAHSDKDGAVTTDLTVDDNWTQGNHTITAKDADGYTTKIGSKIMVVPQGEAHTPGPNGAPPDDVTGTVLATITFSNSANQNGPGTQTLHITGHADPQGGTVCGDNDDGKPITHNETTNGVAATVATTQTCSGTYKAGRLTYTETVTNAKFTFTKDGITVTCPATTPFTNLHLEGTFTNATTISGGASFDRFIINCDQGVGPLTIDGQTGTWTGTMQ